MKQEGFEFQCRSLSSDTIEEEICIHYSLGTPGSSGLPWFIEAGKHINLNLSSTYGSISCIVFAYKKKDSDLYTVEVSSVDITKPRR